MVLLVTGVCGAGKSAVARRLRQWGHHTVSLDGDTRLCSWTNRNGARISRPDHPDTGWLALHHWTWHPQRLDQMISDARTDGVNTLWLCGQAANAVDLADRFDAYMLLCVDAATMRERILAGAERGNDFGWVGDTLTAALAPMGEFEAVRRYRGATPIDATQDLNRVCEDLLMAAARYALARPMAPPTPTNNPYL